MMRRGNEPCGERCDRRRRDYLDTSHAGSAFFLGEAPLAKRNYGFEKRQKEIRRQLKKEEKKQKKLDRAKDPAEATPSEPPASDDPTRTP